MLNIKDLKYWDYVIYNNKPSIVYSLPYNEVSVLQKGDIRKKTFTTLYRILRPIYLTTELLVNSGFEDYKDNSHDYLRIQNKHGTWIYLEKEEEDKFKCTVGRINPYHLATVNCVHQLQHLLDSLDVDYKIKLNTCDGDI